MSSKFNKTPLSKNKIGLVVHSCNSGTWEMEAREPGVQGQLQLYYESEASLDYMWLCFKKQTRRRWRMKNKIIIKYNLKKEGGEWLGRHLHRLFFCCCEKNTIQRQLAEGRLSWLTVPGGLSPLGVSLESVSLCIDHLLPLQFASTGVEAESVCHWPNCRGRELRAHILEPQA